MTKKLKRNKIIVFIYRLIKITCFKILYNTFLYKLFYPHKTENIIETGKKYRLVVCHNGGGGTGSYMKNKYGNLPGVLFLYKLHSADIDYIYRLQNSDTNKTVYIKPRQLSVLNGCISEVNIVAVESYINIDLVLNWFKSLNVPITYDLHDYHCVWYEAHFVHNGKYLSKSELEKSVLKYGRTKITFAQWHKIWQDFFPSVERINAFSESSKKIFGEYYPDFVDKVIVTPHSLDYIKCGTLKKIPKKFTVGIFGSILDSDKGCDVVHSFLKYSKNKDYQVYFNGELSPSCKVKAANIKYMGRYDVSKLDKIIEEQGISVVLFPSICPETFSYTISELIHVGIPVACFDIGAQAEKISEYKYGEIISDYSNNAIFSALKKAFQKTLLPGEKCENQIPLSIDEIKKTELNILIEFADFCKKNNLKYYLAYGTLLGAIRHKGFIPWDDDIDVYMPRPDYDKFLKLTGFSPIKANLETRLYDYCAHTNIYPFAKIIDTDSIVYEKGKSKANVSGIWIDIFPLDAFPLEVNKAKKLFNKYLTLRKFQDLATTYPFFANQNLFKKIYKTVFVAPFIRLYDVKKICKKMDLLAQTYSYEDSEAVADLTWGDNIESYVMKDELEPSIEVEFENHMFAAPNKWHEYLTRVYGDYMKLPPVEQRIVHGFTAYSLNQDK